MEVVYTAEKKNNLQRIKEDTINLILENKKWVHPNVINMVKKRDNEGIWMALNQIQYGSIKDSGDVSNTKFLTFSLVSHKKDGNPSLTSGINRSHNVFRKESKVVDTNKKNHKANFVELEFLKGQEHMVDEWILKEALEGEDFFTNRALGQIHERSLASTKPPPQNRKRKYSFFQVIGNPSF